jgi:hypothetical protein
MQADEFGLVDGPACSPGESCPDFSASSAPLRFGYVSVTQVKSGLPAGTSAHFAYGIDNWQLKVWKR